MKLLEGQEAGDREKEGTDVCRESTYWKKEGRDVSVERKGETEGKVVLSCRGALERNNTRGIWGGERCYSFAGLSQQFPAFPRDYVCAEGVRKQPPLIGNRDTRLAGRMVGDPQQMREMIPTQAGHTELCGCSHGGCKAAPTHTSPRTSHESEPRVRVHCARCLEQLDQRLKEANRMDGGGRGTYIPNASH